jgi:triosephosphate isomerase
MSRVKLIVGNWKMNGSFAANTTLLSALTAVPAVKIVVAPPAVYLASSYAQLTIRPLSLPHKM